MIQSLPIGDIRRDGGTQQRAETNMLVVADYAEAYRNGADMPPLVVFYDGSHFWLADGFHRLAGAEKAGFSEIDCDVREGTCRDAKIYACGANKTHGLRRSNEDKRRAVETLLMDEEWGQESDHKIAGYAGVTQPTVTNIRHNLEATNKIYQSPIRKGADGRLYNTSNIGKKKPVAAQTEGGNGATTRPLANQPSMFTPDSSEDEKKATEEEESEEEEEQSKVEEPEKEANPPRQQPTRSTAPAPEPEKSGSLPPEKLSPPRRSEAERLHELLEDYVKTFDSMTCKIEGRPEYKGCGGIAHVVDGIPARELQLLKGRIELVIERLQEWVEVIGERL